MSHQAIKTVFGGGTVGNYDGFKSTEEVEQLFSILKRYGVTTIDTAQGYYESQRVLGENKAGSQFTIDTKWVGGWSPGFSTKEQIISSAKKSLDTLGMSKVDIFYMHAPDAAVPISETLAGVNEVYKSGGFARFGLSNYTPSDVEKVYEHCKEHGYVLPTVYQGNYNAVARKQETILFPLLRKLGIAFYAYSPLAGGFLTKTKQQVLDGAGRFDTSQRLGQMYSGLYARPSFFEALDVWDATAKEAGCSRAELAYRWVAYNSPLRAENGDALIIGASNLKQLEQTCEGLKAGPLSAEVVKKIDQVWETIKHEAPIDNYEILQEKNLILPTLQQKEG